LIKNLYECQGYNAQQFIEEFPVKLGRRTASRGCWWSWECSEQFDV